MAHPSAVGSTVARRRDALGIAVVVPTALLAAAAVGWWWSARMVDDMSGDMTAGDMGMGDMGMGAMGDDALSLGAFVVAWAAMMAAMMFPAVTPVVRLYGRAAAMGRVAPLPFFVAGYLVVWTAIGFPAYAAWRALMDPIADAEPWAGRLAGGVLLLAALWQLTPLKSVCLRHCRSPMSVFLRAGAAVTRPAGALRLGGTHGLFCLGCCWALMAVLVSVGTMNLAWMAALALLILVEKNAPAGEGVARLAALAFVALGVVLLARPETLSALT